MAYRHTYARGERGYHCNSYHSNNNFGGKPMQQFEYIRRFRDLGIDDVPLVGGKNASLGEMYQALSDEGVKVPNGFATTAQAYRDYLTHTTTWKHPSVRHWKN